MASWEINEPNFQSVSVCVGVVDVRIGDKGVHTEETN